MWRLTLIKLKFEFERAFHCLATQCKLLSVLGTLSPIYTTENFCHGSGKHGTKKCSTDSPFTRPSFCRPNHGKVKFWYGKIKFWYELWAQFFGQHTTKPPQYACVTLYLNMVEEKYLECLVIKGRHLPLGLMRSAEVNKPVSLEHFLNKLILPLFSNFTWTFLYAALSFSFGVSALSKLKSIVSSFMTSRKSSLDGRSFSRIHHKNF